MYIVIVFDVGEEVDLVFMVMDYVDGRLLDCCVFEGILLDIEEVYLIVVVVVDVLYYVY